MIIKTNLVELKALLEKETARKQKLVVALENLKEHGFKNYTMSVAYDLIERDIDEFTYAIEDIESEIARLEAA